MIIDTLAEDPRWNEAGLAALARRAASVLEARLPLPPEAEISLLGCDDARIASLNADFRDRPTPTNVLSWPARDLSRPATSPPGTPPAPPAPDTAELGDIAISWDTCTREAREQDKPLADHVTHLLLHGMLHLLGYDHIDEKDAALMEALEVELLGKLGIPDPYERGGH